MLVKHEHDIEKKLRLTPLWIITLLNLNFMMAGIFGYSIRHLNLLFVVILLIGLSFYLPIGFVAQIKFELGFSLTPYLLKDTLSRWRTQMSKTV